MVGVKVAQVDCGVIGSNEHPFAVYCAKRHDQTLAHGVNRLVVAQGKAGAFPFLPDTIWQPGSTSRSVGSTVHGNSAERISATCSIKVVVLGCH